MAQGRRLYTGELISREVRKITLIYLLGLSPLYLRAQFINGVVYNAATDSVIANATVYYSGSLTATITNSLGHFKLPAKQGGVPLIISYIGYHSETIFNYIPNEALQIFLKPKNNELQEVIIRNDGMSREEKVQRFTREFLGTSEFSLSCIITNIDDIDLAYNKKNKRFPLVAMNRSKSSIKNSVTS